MSPLCTQFATFPVTVEDGDGFDVVTTGDGDDDGVEEARLGVGLGALPLEVGVTAVCDTPVPAALGDEWPRPTATTAPAVPPAINTHPTANAAIVARLRPAPGIPTPGNLHP